MTANPHPQPSRTEPGGQSATRVVGGVGTTAGGSLAQADPLDAAHLQERIEARDHRRGGTDPLLRVRSSDLEPYTGLGYLSKLFRLIAVLLLVLLVAEVGVGVYSEGTGSLRTLITEASRLLVIAGVLWGAGDLATLLIDIGHDVRASRILLGRQTTHADELAAAHAATRVDAAPRDRDVPPRPAPRADAAERPDELRMS